jgi:two-component system LytT family response regulator
MYKVVIIEDDAELAQTLAKVIGNEAPFFEIKGIAPSIAEGEKLIAEVDPDVAFFDVELSDGLSFDLLERLPSVRFEIIFVTAFSNYAFNAFKYSAIDFVTKPIDPEDIRRASERAIQSIEKNNIDQRVRTLLLNRKQDQLEQHIVLQTAISLHIVKVKNIIRCESDVNYTTFYLTDGKSIVVSRTLGEFEKILPSCFFRVHRSHLINLNFVLEVKKQIGIVILSNNEKVEFSLRRKDAFLQALKEFCCP